MAIQLLRCDSNPDDPRLEPALHSLAGVAVEPVRTVHHLLQLIRRTDFDVILVSFPIEEWTPEETLEAVQRIDPGIPVLIRHDEATLQDAVRWTRLGAFQLLGGDVSAVELSESIAAASRAASSRKSPRGDAKQDSESWRRLLVGDSRAMRNVHEVIRLIGARRSTVLITGETGTGKEMVARAIHMASPRASQQMVPVNCSALPENLPEAELFGHVKGAFTGAVGNRVGRFEQAHRGTIFLDEIGDMPLELQAKLLRVLQEREFQRLGSSETVKVDVRVIAASNVDLVERVREGRFREDLYYRLNVVPLSLPPLRERRRDVPLLVEHFLEKVCRQESLPPREVSYETLDRLTRVDWPGNVRQLENAVEMAVALSGDRRTLVPGDFPLPAFAQIKTLADTEPIVAVPDDGIDFQQTVERIERALLEQAMRKAGGNKRQAADMLGLKRTTFTAKLKSLEAVAC